MSAFSLEILLKLEVIVYTGLLCKICHFYPNINIYLTKFKYVKIIILNNKYICICFFTNVN